LEFLGIFKGMKLSMAKEARKWHRALSKNPAILNRLLEKVRMDVPLSAAKTNLMDMELNMDRYFQMGRHEGGYVIRHDLKSMSLVKGKDWEMILNHLIKSQSEEFGKRIKQKPEFKFEKD
jgi:hypothetical protein